MKKRKLIVKNAGFRQGLSLLRGKERACVTDELTSADRAVPHGQAKGYIPGNLQLQLSVKLGLLT